MKLAIARASLSNLINQVRCIQHMQFTIKMRNEMNYLSHNIDWMFECRGVINIPNKYSKKASEVKTSKQRSIKIRLKQSCQVSIKSGAFPC